MSLGGFLGELKAHDDWFPENIVFQWGGPPCLPKVANGNDFDFHIKI